MPQYAMLKLPIERHAQLKALSHVRGVSMVTLVSGLINAEIANGLIADEVMGFVIDVVDGKVSVAVGGQKLAPMTPTEARQFASLLIEIPVATKMLNLDIPSFPVVSRMGMGVTVEAKDVDSKPVKRTLSLGVAYDVARLVRAAADRA